MLILLNADNKREGGTLSLMSLAQQAFGRSITWLAVLGMIGAALFYSDVIITLAISVLSAVEGLKVVTPDFEAYILPLTLVIILGLLLVQSQGTGPVAPSSVRSRWCGLPRWLAQMADRENAEKRSENNCIKSAVFSAFSLSPEQVELVSLG